ncbi:RlmE family RNA methyltransferase [Desulfurivibrio alkaliphilus]|uniref:Ribosomal RNA large subunit methyltransferase E n=1 Tax=Desulfurivibrio alkaliphilus (strain DSM 19089 / UNIQEM U267 / AHT2) TaxID=589865 RepID=D6Z2Y2_DESAT|nr:RlmE family RNA methyltransferase [Desulfurivibrio alkaliphilus]ADH85907.1 ribosomal RNA methyltransferase RrmJ/FtsJ [Desulfurivibrio alkaliphilus AHT 2]
MKQVQDFYFRKARKEGYPARSVYKLEEAQQKFKLLRPGDKVLDLGCQPGSWSIYAARVVGRQGLVVGVDITAGPIKTRGGAPFHFVLGDITRESVQEKVRGICSRYRVLISDMAPRTTGNRWADQQQSLRLARTVLELAANWLQPGGHLYCKVFEGEDFQELVADVRRSFGKVKVFKPKSSRTESREVFLLAMDYKG